MSQIWPITIRAPMVPHTAVIPAVASSSPVRLRLSRMTVPSAAGANVDRNETKKEKVDT